MKKASLPVEQDGAPLDRAVRFEDELWQHGFTVIPNLVVSEAMLSPGAFRIYALFLYYAREDDHVWPGQDGLARVSGMGERTIRTAIRELEDRGLLRTVRRGLGKTNLYLLLVPRRSAESADPEPQIRPILPYLEPDAVEEGPSPVGLAWAEHAPPLIAHRGSYYTSPKTKTAIRAALRVYDVESIVSAIASYATVLGSDEYRWSYSWGMVEFLKRGLDKFVPEADPLSNFRAFGKRPAGPSVDLSDLDELT